MRGRYTDSNTVRQKNKYVRLLVTVGSILLAAGILFMIAKFSYNHFFKKYNSSINVDSLYKFWEAKDYKKVYDISNEIIAKDFLNNAARTLHGYSSFMLAAAQTESQSNQDLLDEAIINIRIALQYAKENMVPQLEYMLGKAYFYKDGMKNSADAEDGGEHESHYYADLAIKYLTMSREAGFTADDLFEHLGFSYKALGETLNSIAAFSQVLDTPRESDKLLLAIAEQYCNAKETASAKQYLKRTKDKTQDDEIYLRASFLLAQICFDEGRYEEAEKQFNEILEKDKKNVDAYYGLGLIYEKQGDDAEARAEYRKILAYSPRHYGARKKLASGS